MRIIQIMDNKNINSPDCVNLSFYGLDYTPHLTGFIFTTMKEIWKPINEAIIELKTLKSKLYVKH